MTGNTIILIFVLLSPPIANLDPKDFIVGYESMLSYIQDPFKWRQAEIELAERGVKAMTFFDIVLDFIILDAFNDLSCPPSSVMAVVQNRFLSNGFKGMECVNLATSNIALYINNLCLLQKLH